MGLEQSVVSTLVAKLILDTAEFVKGSDSATKKIGAIAGGLSAVGSGATKVAKDAVNSAMEFETAFTGVMKTVEAPEGSDAVEFFSGLRKEILGMSSELPSTATEIAGVYQAAGQLGIEAENLTGFSRAMIQLASATNLSSEEAATGLAQFANVMGTDQTLFENMGSSIVALGNNFATNEAQIVNFAQEMAIAGKLAGLSEADVLGFGTAMASMGLDAASSGTAFQRFTQTLTSEVASWDSAAGEGSNSLKQIAETAGMTSEQFVEAWGTDATGAIQAFLSGLGEMDVSDQLDLFEDLEIGQQQEITMLQSLASNTGLVTDAIDMSNKAWGENTALSAEAGAANATTAAQLAMTRNRVTELAINIGETLLPIIRDILKFLSPIIEKIAKFASEHPKLTKGLVLLGIALGVIGGLLSTLLPFITMLSGASGIAAVGAALGGLIAPAMPVIAVIGLIIAGFLLLKTAIENNFLGLGDRFEELKQKLSPVVDAVKGYFNDLKETFENGGLEAVLVKLGQDAAQLVTDAIASVFNLVGDIGNTALGKIQDAWTNISAEIESWSFVQTIKGKWEELTSAFDTGGILGVLSQLKNDIVGAFEGLWEGSPIKTAIDTVTNGIHSAFQWLYDILVGHSIVPDLIDAVVNCFSGWWDRIKGFVEDVVNGVVDFFKDIDPKLSEYLNNLDISEALSNFIQGIGNSVKGFWETHVKGAFTGSDGLAGKIGSWIGEIDLLGAAQNHVDKIKTGISSAWDSFKEWFKGLFKGLFDSIEIPDWMNPKKWFGGGKKE